MSSMAYLLLCLFFSSLLAVTSAEDVEDDSSVLPRAPCPPGVFHYNGFCYEFIQAETFWENAEVLCSNWVRGAHLASILTSSEERMVTNFIRRYSKAETVWIGLKAEDNGKGLLWRWSDLSKYDSGSPLWDKRSPETCNSDKQLQHCIALSNVQTPGDASRWAQHKCEDNYPYVCKYRSSF